MSDPKYDVFLSFRGEDTREKFTSHVYTKLVGKMIKTFIDDKLERGDEINSSLIEAIEESKIYVIILSKHYASSHWCLDELTKILECKKTYGREVIPVFYEVDPSDVRHQRQTYAEDFLKHHQHRPKDKIDAWKAALTQVANLSGWDSQSQVTSPESTLVEKIAEDILKKLNRHVPSDYYEGMTGMDKHIEKIQTLLLQLESLPVRIIGICGMGGVGKTTIATAIFEKLATQFNFKSRVLNVQKKIEKDGPEKVRKKYLSQLLRKDTGIDESDILIVQKLIREKVLLVFDDVKDFDQLQNLYGTHDNFAVGSIIIVTCRDRQVLENANAHEIYQVKEMDYNDSLQLFCLFAFKQNHPKESFESLTEKFLDYAKGLPLALKVLGSLLYRKKIDVWKSQLEKLETLPNLKIFSWLKLSYDELDSQQKNIFLDIACFYRGDFEKFVEKILDCCGYSTRSELNVLQDRCLISISVYGTVRMHDLIQEMGHEIVRLQCENEPEKRSRLWKSDDIYEVFKKDRGQGTDAIQCIFMDMMEIKKVQLHPVTFKKMHKLRIIQFRISGHPDDDSNVTFKENALLESLPNALKILHWDEFPQISLPQDFCPENLVILNMHNSDLEQLCKENQALPNLKRLCLNGSCKLKRLPDLSLCPNIEEVILSDCVSLIEVYSSSFLDKLNWLCLDGCTKLERLDIRSNILWRSSGLVALHGCHNLETLLINSGTDVVQSDSCPPFYDAYFASLSVCVFDDKISLRYDLERGYEIGECDSDDSDDSDKFTSINEFCWLDVSDCESLTCLPDEHSLNLKFVTRLCFSGCLKLEELPEIKETIENLKVLLLDKTTIKELPSSLDRLVGLEELNLQNCTKLKTIPSSIGNLSKLHKLDLAYCESLETFPSSIFKLKLTELDFEGCSMLGTFPEIPNDSACLSSLTELSLKGSSIVNLPESMAHLSSLRSLNLSDCELLECVPKLPPNLNQVLAFDCPSIKRMMLNSSSASEEGTFEFLLTNSQKLDATCMSNIEEEAYTKINDDAYRSVLFCFPGSAIPDWFPHRCQGHSISIRSDDLYLYGGNKLIGFALCVVLGRDFPYECFYSNPRFRSGIGFTYILKFEHWQGQTHFHPNKFEVKYDWIRMRSFDQDHTFLWKFDLTRIDYGLIDAHTITFQILDEHDRPLSFPTTMTVKECGICPLYTKEYDDNSIEESNWDAVCLLDLDLSLGGNYT